MLPTNEQILEAINKSGYLFEQEVGTIIENQNFHIQTNSAFKDLDENKSREIDVVGFKRFVYDKELKISIDVRILCECKNNTNPFVFISRKKNEFDKNYSPPNFLFPKDDYHEPIPNEPNSYYVRNGFMFYKINEIFPYTKSETKSVQFCKLIPKGKEWNAHHEQIYDSILLPITKCLEYFKKKDKKSNSYDGQNFIIYFPIVVVNSKIYNINSSDPNYEVKEVDYISFTREIESEKQKNKYLIDFVNKDSLNLYIENNIKSFINLLTERLK
ncbi:hypothetical protein LUD75_14500 [Epilithonimonas sp. JDS]|uniref:hypothetical protein n=1 Tax=Epilithonimonas sp. JDS TaxID=2902797 RepID=UPI001E403D89|nr:hypothetical protein [Epilithonimonas sp. JDS]MCD9855933.1 hypothetical protein [Epilithonimonas sp. JDS]